MQSSVARIPRMQVDEAVSVGRVSSAAEEPVRQNKAKDGTSHPIAHPASLSSLPGHL